jgi:hypothetical protein
LAKFIDRSAGNEGHGCQGVSVKWGGAIENRSQSHISDCS